MTSSIAWLDGQWGTTASLKLPLDDRALLLADGLFETVLVRNGEPQLLEEHLQRWTNSAALLGMDPPPQRNAVEPLLQEAIQRNRLSEGHGALRLNWSRGSTEQRGIGLPASGHHRFWLTLHPCTPTFTSITTITSRHECRNASSRLSRCKTFAYGQAIQARREAQDQGADDALLLNTAGVMSCGTAANLLVRRHGQWLTPPLSSGCLPGVMRGRALAQGIAVETELTAEFDADDQAVLINSLSCRPIASHNGQPMAATTTAVELWHALLH
ncbi:4-amino-4-deoxychorismate lyase [Synechococcus sp. KORDI-52]|uniref:aminotransferase class IV n=1 Tax=Synechococcus sp. KORDI-52 TaxID=585425 RepID=UPI0004E062D7|nr:aminotransferase class IV [Synechococcus sp. KORDI-52]AII48116.1 4-amino-4-deoxychorismate lyase [Synechococcus sp. KORDI-52]